MASTLKSNIDCTAVEPPREATLALFPMRNFLISQLLITSKEIKKRVKSKTEYFLEGNMMLWGWYGVTLFLTCRRVTYISLFHTPPVPIRTILAYWSQLLLFFLYYWRIEILNKYLGTRTSFLRGNKMVNRNLLLIRSFYSEKDFFFQKRNSIEDVLYRVITGLYVATNLFFCSSTDPRTPVPRCDR